MTGRTIRTPHRRQAHRVDSMRTTAPGGPHHRPRVDDIVRSAPHPMLATASDVWRVHGIGVESAQHLMSTAGAGPMYRSLARFATCDIPPGSGRSHPVPGAGVAADVGHGSDASHGETG